LKAIGTASLPKLRLALKSKDAESRRRAADIIEDIESGSMAARLTAAARLLQNRRPEGTVGVLIDYLPFAKDAAVEEEVLGTLTLLGVQAGKADPALVAALQSQAPAQRAAGAMLVGWAGTPEQRLSVKKLLNDPDARVRFRAAQGILAGGDKAAVPTLISLLEGVPFELSLRAEDLLQRAAGDLAPSITLAAPSIMLGESEVGRKLCAAAWRDWSQSHLEKLDLAKRDVSLPLCNINLRAKDVALRWVGSLVKRDPSTLKKASDFPFTVATGSHFLVFNKGEELDQFFQNADKTHDAELARMTFEAKHVVSVDRYLESGMTSSRESNRGRDEAVTQLSALLLWSKIKMYL
jgi:HEAT repeats